MLIAKENVRIFFKHKFLYENRKEEAWYYPHLYTSSLSLHFHHQIHINFILLYNVFLSCMSLAQNEEKKELFKMCYHHDVEAYDVWKYKTLSSSFICVCRCIYGSICDDDEKFKECLCLKFEWESEWR